MKPIYFPVWLAIVAAFGCTTEEVYSVTLQSALNTNGRDELGFMTSPGALVFRPAKNYRGAHWISKLLPAGADPISDAPIAYQWGTVPSNLLFQFTATVRVPPGAYDLSTVVYAGTEISTAMRAADPGLLPLPKNGDLTIFTVDPTQVRKGDPNFSPGTLRVNVDDRDVTLDVQNHISTETDEPEVRKQAFINTYLYLP